LQVTEAPKLHVIGIPLKPQVIVAYFMVNLTTWLPIRLPTSVVKDLLITVVETERLIVLNDYLLLRFRVYSPIVWGWSACPLFYCSNLRHCSVL